MLLYTWKDVERKLWLNREKWKNIINDIEIYAEEMVIHLNNNDSVNAAKNRINEILDNKYDDEKISLDLPGAFLKVVFEIEETGKKEEENDNVIPLFKNVLYQKSAYYSELIDKELPGAPVLAFHSYKGGVGRTLSVLAFVKAWSSLTDLKNPKRLLIV